MALTLPNLLFWCALAMDLTIATLVLRKRLAGSLGGMLFYALFHLVCGVLLTFVGTYYLWTNLYAVTFWLYETIRIGAMLYLAYALCQMGLERYRGFHRLALVLSIAYASVLLLILTLNMERITQRTSGPNTYLTEWFALVSKSASFFTASLLLGFFAFVALFGISLSRIVRDSAICLFLFSVCRAIMYTWIAQFPSANRFASLLRQASALFLVAGWAWALWRHREEEFVQTGPMIALKPNREELELRIQTMNRALIRLLD